MREVETKLFYRKGKKYGWIYLPEKLVLDSAFPLPRKNCKVKVKIEGKKLVIE